MVFSKIISSFISGCRYLVSNNYLLGLFLLCLFSVSLFLFFYFYRYFLSLYLTIPRFFNMLLYFFIFHMVLLLLIWLVSVKLGVWDPLPPVGELVDNSKNNWVRGEDLDTLGLGPFTKACFVRLTFGFTVVYIGEACIRIAEIFYGK